MESKFCLQGIGIRQGTALGRNVDPIYNKAKSYYHVLVAFPSFYSFLFIDPLPLFTDMVLMLFRKVISEISEKSGKMEHPCWTRDHCCTRTITYLKLGSSQLN